MKVGARNHEGASCQVRISLALPKRMRDRTREITKVQTPAKLQGQGLATKLIEHVCEEADKDGMTLVLWPRPFGDIALSQAMLISWYQRFGFQVIQPDPVLMARPPGRAVHELTVGASAALLYG